MKQDPLFYKKKQDPPSGGSSGKPAGSYVVSKISDLRDKVLPFFDNHPILGNKHKDYVDFKTAVGLVMKKAHLTAEGLAEIRNLKEGMNTGRDVQE